MPNKLKLVGVIIICIVVFVFGLKYFLHIYLQDKSVQNSLVEEKLNDNTLQKTWHDYYNSDLNIGFKYFDYPLDIDSKIEKNKESFMIELHPGTWTVYGFTNNYISEETEPSFMSNLPISNTYLSQKPSFKTDSGLVVHVIQGGMNDNISGQIAEDAKAYVITSNEIYSQIVIVGRENQIPYIVDMVKSFKFGSHNKDEVKSLKVTEYKNDYLGLSFVMPTTTIETNAQSGGGVLPFVYKGLKGKAFYGELTGTQISLAGATSDFSEGSEYECGALSTLDKYQKQASLYGELVNKKGYKYVYAHIEPESDSPYNVAYFKLRKSVFPVVGFCDRDLKNEKNFMSIIDSVQLFDHPLLTDNWTITSDKNIAWGRVYYDPKWKFEYIKYKTPSEKSASVVGYMFTLPSGSVISYGGHQGDCLNQNWFEYGNDTSACLDGVRVDIEPLLNQEDKKAFGDFVLKNTYSLIVYDGN